MSAGSVTTISPSAAGAPRRPVSIYDRLEEARERRESVLRRQPANISTLTSASSPSFARANLEPASAPEIEMPETPPVVLPEPAQTQSATMGRVTKWVVWILSALLLILTGIAYYRLESAPPAPAPDFAPPVVSLAPQAYGPPLLASVSHRRDRTVTSGQPTALVLALAGQTPGDDVSAPAPRAPALIRSIDTPRIPTANPAPLIILPNDVRPPQRPDVATLIQATN